MGQPLVQVDSFTHPAFDGNLPVVCILTESRAVRVLLGGQLVILMRGGLLG